MNRPEYSDLPWHIDRTYGSEMIVDAQGGVMFVDTSNDTPEGTAEYIVHCVNNCEALLDALERIMYCLDNRLEVGPSTRMVARAAITAAQNGGTK